jgi:hypothetical protein
MTIIPERLAALDTIYVDSGSHASWDDGACAMEVVAWLAGEGMTDAPACASPILGAFVRSLNDKWDDATRQRLVPFLPRMVGTAADEKDETRSYMALDWLIREYAPAWLDLAGLAAEAAELRSLRRIVDQVAARDAGPVVLGTKEKAVAAWDAARDVRDAARAATWAAAWAAAWDAALDAARDAATWTAAEDAAWDALRPTVEALQTSGLDLLDRMIVGEWDA